MFLPYCSCSFYSKRIQTKQQREIACLALCKPCPPLLETWRYLLLQESTEKPQGTNSSCRLLRRPTGLMGAVGASPTPFPKAKAKLQRRLTATVTKARNKTRQRGRNSNYRKSFISTKSDITTEFSRQAPGLYSSNEENWNYGTFEMHTPRPKLEFLFMKYRQTKFLKLINSGAREMAA